MHKKLNIMPRLSPSLLTLQIIQDLAGKKTIETVYMNPNWTPQPIGGGEEEKSILVFNRISGRIPDIRRPKNNLYFLL